VGNQSYDIQVLDPQQSPLTILVNGEAFTVEVDQLDAVMPDPSLARAEATARRAGIAEPQSGETGPFEVTAPMPGTVLDVAVQVGDHVESGQILCALEAMKMKSPIRAPRSGTLRLVQIHDGQTVDHGDLLFSLD
jgi:biotin carboxyl carrier protein